MKNCVVIFLLALSFLQCSADRVNVLLKILTLNGKGVPVSNASIYVNEIEVGRTDPTGMIVLKSQNDPGDIIEVRASNNNRDSYFGSSTVTVNVSNSQIFDYKIIRLFEAPKNTLKNSETSMSKQSSVSLETPLQFSLNDAFTFQNVNVSIENLSLVSSIKHTIEKIPEFRPIRYNEEMFTIYVNAERLPVVGAEIFQLSLNSNLNMKSLCHTNGRGSCFLNFKSLFDTPCQLLVRHRSYESKVVSCNVTSGRPVVNAKLAAGRTVDFVFQDEAGKPVSGVRNSGDLGVIRQSNDFGLLSLRIHQKPSQFLDYSFERDVEENNEVFHQVAPDQFQSLQKVSVIGGKPRIFHVVVDSEISNFERSVDWAAKISIQDLQSQGIEILRASGGFFPDEEDVFFLSSRMIDGVEEVVIRKGHEVLKAFWVSDDSKASEVVEFISNIRTYNKNTDVALDRDAPSIKVLTESSNEVEKAHVYLDDKYMGLSDVNGRFVFRGIHTDTFYKLRVVSPNKEYIFHDHFYPGRLEHFVSLKRMPQVETSLDIADDSSSTEVKTRLGVLGSDIVSRFLRKGLYKELVESEAFVSDARSDSEANALSKYLVEGANLLISAHSKLRHSEGGSTEGLNDLSYNLKKFVSDSRRMKLDSTQSKIADLAELYLLKFSDYSEGVRHKRSLSKRNRVFLSRFQNDQLASFSNFSRQLSRL